MSDRTRRLWITGGAATLAALAAGLPAVPAGLEATAGDIRLFATLATAAIVLLVILPGVVIRSLAGRRPVWLGAAVVLLLLGAGTFRVHARVADACTAHYDNRTLIVGTEWTTLGDTYAKSNPGLSKDELLFDATGVPERLWTSASIERCRSRVAVTYFLWLPFVAAGLTALLHTVPSGTLSVGGRAPAAAASAGEVGTTLRYDVFISYRHGGRDAEFAHELLSALERAGYTVAIDERDFPANASFLQEMERCIRESRFTVALISARYFESGNTEEEAIVTKVLDMNDRKRRLIPMVIESVQMPAWLFGLVGIDCTKEHPLVDPFDKLTATLGEPLGRGTSRGGHLRA